MYQTILQRTQCTRQFCRRTQCTRQFCKGHNVPNKSTEEHHIHNNSACAVGKNVPYSPAEHNAPNSSAKEYNVPDIFVKEHNVRNSSASTVKYIQCTKQFCKRHNIPNSWGIQCTKQFCIGSSRAVPMDWTIINTISSSICCDKWLIFWKIKLLHNFDYCHW